MRYLIDELKERVPISGEYENENVCGDRRGYGTHKGWALPKEAVRLS